MSKLSDQKFIKRASDKVPLIIKELAELYPDATCSLEYETPLQLLIATRLSAQCTDARVNLVTPALFAKYPDAEAFANAEVSDVEEIIRSTGFHHAKAQNIVDCCRQIIERHGGNVPSTMEELTALAGVGRKTANLVLGDAFGQPSYVVDTHCIRITNRLGLTRNQEPAKIEQDLRKILPPEESGLFCHRLVRHGRALCMARSPKCNECPLKKHCDFGSEK